MRLAVALGLLLSVAAITWIGRSGYRDADGNSVTVLDAVYYASVSVTTTGYGDITPISPAARARTALVVTPARILFLIVLVGTTIEVLTDRFRRALAISRWRKRVTNHVIVVGYGTKGRGAIQSLLGDGSVRPGELIIIDSNDAALSEPGSRASSRCQVTPRARTCYARRKSKRPAPSSSRATGTTRRRW